jgi:hypothetical protein
VLCYAQASPPLGMEGWRGAGKGKGQRGDAAGDGRAEQGASAAARGGRFGGKHDKDVTPVGSVPVTGAPGASDDSHSPPTSSITTELINPAGTAKGAEAEGGVRAWETLGDAADGGGRRGDRTPPLGRDVSQQTGGSVRRGVRGCVSA